MLFTLDLDQQKLVVSPGSTGELVTITSKRSSVGIIAVQLIQGRAKVTSEIAGFLLKFTAKTFQQFDEDPLVTTSTFAWDSNRNLYVGEVNWITADLNALFGVHGTAITGITGVASTDVITATAHGLAAGDRVVFPTLTGGAGITADTVWYYVKTAPSADTFTISATAGGATLNFTTDITDGSVRHDEEDVASISLGVEVGYKYDSGEEWKLSENQVTLTLLNNYIRDDDGTPDDPTASAALVWLGDHAVRYEAAQALSQTARVQVMENIQLICSALTGGAAGALDSILTASGKLTTGRVAFAVVINEFQVWQLQAGTTAENAANGIVRPDDYDGSTNARIWSRVL